MHNPNLAKHYDIKVNKSAKFISVRSSGKSKFGYYILINGEFFLQNDGGIDVTNFDIIKIGSNMKNFSFDASNNIRIEKQTLFIKFNKDYINFECDNTYIYFDYSNKSEFMNFIVEMIRSWLFSYTGQQFTTYDSSLSNAKNMLHTIDNRWNIIKVLLFGSKYKQSILFGLPRELILIIVSHCNLNKLIKKF